MEGQVKRRPPKRPLTISFKCFPPLGSYTPKPEGGGS